jgi:hypothetical protein
MMIFKENEAIRVIPTGGALADSEAVDGCWVWSEVAQEEICQMKNGLVFKKEGVLPQWESSWWFFSSWQLEGQPKMELFSYQKLN